MPATASPSATSAQTISAWTGRIMKGRLVLVGSPSAGDILVKELLLKPVDMASIGG